MSKKLFAIALIAALSGRAAAEDFTFTVPISVSGIPAPIHQMAVACMVISDTPLPNGSSIIGTAERRVSLVDGAFSGDVVVAFNATLPETRHRARQYSCLIPAFYEPVVPPRGGRVYYTANARTDPDLFFPLAAGAPFVVATGTLPLP